MKKLGDDDHGSAKVKGGAKGKKKAASKGKKVARKSDGEVGKSVKKLLNYSSSKSKVKNEGTPSKGKVSTKKSLGKKITPSMPSPGGKKSNRTTD